MFKQIITRVSPVLLFSWHIPFSNDEQRSRLFRESECVLNVNMQVLIHLFISLHGAWSVQMSNDSNSNSRLVSLACHLDH